MMIPMINEVIRCLDEGIIASPAEADIALVYGLGFLLSVVYSVTSILLEQRNLLQMHNNMRH